MRVCIQILLTFYHSVIQRQTYLLQNTPLTPPQAYDKARKELYRYRHSREIERRVAREEAEATGAFFGLGPLEVGMQLEDEAYKEWVDWAKKETEALKQLAQGAAGGATSVAGAEDPENDAGVRVEALEQDAAGAEVEGRKAPDTGGREAAMEELNVREVAGSVPGSRRGQTALGGQAVHP